MYLLVYPHILPQFSLYPTFMSTNNIALNLILHNIIENVNNIFFLNYFYIIYVFEKNLFFEIDFSTLMTPVNDSPSRDGDTDYETEHDLRRKQLSSLDPVHMLQLKEFFQSQVFFLSYTNMWTDG